MKHLFSLTLSIISIVAVAALYALHFTSAKTHSVAIAVADSTVTAQPGSIVYIQLDTLFNQYDMTADKKAELEAKVTDIQNDLNKKGRAFENDVKSFQDQMSKGLLTRSEAEKIQNDLAVREQDLQNLNLAKQQEMAEEQAVMVNKVMDAIQTYVKKFNETYNYSLILTTSAATNTVLEGNQGLDITKLVLAGLNDEYAANRKDK